MWGIQSNRFPQKLWVEHTLASRLIGQIHCLKEGALTVAVTYNGGVALASVRQVDSALIMDVGTRHIARVTDSIAVLCSGLAADSR